MPTLQQPYVSQEIQQLIAEIRSEDQQFEQELRFHERDKLILPVAVRFLNGKQHISTFSRNLSPSGICLVSEQLVEPDAMAVLQIYRQENPSSEVVAKCKWCHRFGNQYWISGWEFHHVPMQ